LNSIRIELQPKQIELLQLVDESPHTVIGFGGAKGGAKSHGAREVILLRRLKYPGTNGGIFRRTSGELYRNHVEPLFRQRPELREGYNEQRKELRLPGGSKLYFGYAEHKGDIYKATQGIEFADMLIDEATHFQESELVEFRTSNRWTKDASIVPKTILTTNPGNAGHDYIKRIFVDRKYEANESAEDYAFIQAYAWDNVEWSRRALIADGITDREYYSWSDEARFRYFTDRTDYGKTLNSLPEKRRRALLYGDWDSFEGQYFPNFVVEQRERPAHHVEALIQPWWSRWISMDWGYAHASAVYWHAKGLVSPADAKKYLDRDWDKSREVVLTYRERVEAGVGERQWGARIVEATGKEKIGSFFLDPSAFAKKTSANTIAEEIGDVTKDRIPLPELADNDRIGGWRLMHQVIEADEWFISSDCPGLLSAIPVLKHDEVRREDVEKTEEVSDDIADSVRYGLKSMLASRGKPLAVVRQETMAAVFKETQDMTAVHMSNLRFQATHKPVQWGRRRK
jgi:phage terminase large subunit